MAIKSSKLKTHSTNFAAWLRESSERFAIFILAVATALICCALLFSPQEHAGEEGKEHGAEHGEEHADDHGAEEGQEEGEEDHELAVEIEDDVLKSAGLALEQAQSIEIQPHITSRGQIIENGNRSMNVKPRFSGLVKTVYKDFGDQVRKGETLMLVENAATRSSYSIKTAIDGIVADKRVVSGSFIPENESVFRIVDLSSVWFQARLPLRDVEKLKVGFSANIRDRLLNASGKGKIHYLSPTVDEDTQACDVRIELDNAKGQWKIGSFAEADILLDPISVKVAVKTAAIQVLNDQTVIFKREGDHLIATPVRIGWSDDTWSEVSSGMTLNDTYVSTNSFIAKAELLKSSAEHEH